MKFEVGRNELLSAVSAVVGVVERRQTLPILSNLLMRVDEERLTLVGTDLEIELTSFAQVRVLKTGEVTVPARKLFDICRGLPEGAEITLEAGEGKATLRSANSRFVLSTLEAQEFPSLDTEATAHAFSAPQGKLKALIDRTQFAMAAQDVRYYLNGLCIHLLPAAVRSVATDGHRLAMRLSGGEQSGGAFRRAVGLPGPCVTRHRDGTGMPKLWSDVAASGMNRLGHARPARQGGLTMEQRHPRRVARCRPVNHGALGEDQADTAIRAAAVILRVCRSGNPALRHVSRHRGHDDAVGKRQAFQ